MLEGLFKVSFWNFLGGTEENCQFRLASSSDISEWNFRMSYEGHKPLNHTLKPTGCRMRLIALVISGSCEYSSTALCGRLLG